MAYGAPTANFNSASPFSNNGGIEDALQRALNKGSPTMDDLAAFARSNGYGVDGPNYYRNNGGGQGSWRETAPLGILKDATRGQTPGADLPPLLLQSLLQDTGAMQGAANRQFDRNNAQISSIDQFLGGIRGTLQGQSAASAQDLSRFGDRAMGMGTRQLHDYSGQAQDLYGDISGRVNATNAGVDRINSGIDRTLSGQMPQFYNNINGAEADINKGYGLGDEAVSGYQQTMSNFQDRTAQDASVIAAGIRRSGMTAMKQARAGIRPDGTPMTAAEQDDAINEIRGQTADQVQSQITPLFSQYNTAMASMGATLAQLRKGNADMRLQGAGIKGQLEGQRLAGVDTETKARGTQLQGEQLKAQGTQTLASTGASLADGYLKAQQGERDMTALGADLHKFSASLKDASLLQVVNLEMSGRFNMAQLVQQNPETMVSWFQGLLAMYSAKAASTGNTKIA